MYLCNQKSVMVLITTSLINSKMENQKKTMTKEEFAEFNTEMARLKEIKWKGYTRTLKEIGISYLGNVAQSAKLRHSYYHQVSTYGIYLAPSTLSGFNVCPNSDYCKENCLNESGHNKVELLAKRAKAQETGEDFSDSDINLARILKTRLFFANREVFMRLAVHEINNAMKRAKTIGHFFSVRLNCTSDISPTAFVLDGKNILQIFPNVSFYDYTKVPKRLELLSKYPNYDLTWSIDGSEENREIGLEFLERGGRVAVVYGTEKMPKSWYGYATEDGDRSDYRPQDINQVCMLKFKVTASNYENGKFLLPQTDFILTEGAENVEW